MPRDETCAFPALEMLPRHCFQVVSWVVVALVRISREDGTGREGYRAGDEDLPEALGRASPGLPVSRASMFTIFC